MYGAPTPLQLVLPIPCPVVGASGILPASYPKDMVVARLGNDGRTAFSAGNNLSSDTHSSSRLSSAARVAQLVTWGDPLQAQ
jgi:hypothetical protein